MDRTLLEITQQGDCERKLLPGMHPTNVDGLWLKVKATGSKSFVWRGRMQVNGKSTPVMRGLGPFPAVSFKQAESLAIQERAKATSGTLAPKVDRAAKAKARVGLAGDQTTFETAAREYVTFYRPDWKNAKHHKDWLNTLERWVFPAIGGKQVAAVSVDDVIAILKAITTPKNDKAKPRYETAERVRSRIEKIIDRYFVLRFVTTYTNPALKKIVSHHVKILPKSKRVKRQKSMRWELVPAFVAELRKVKGVSARAVEFVILTAARDNEVRFMQWEHVDFKKRVWAVPAEGMKMSIAHRVPLSTRAIEILLEMRKSKVDGSNVVFPTTCKGKEGVALSNGAMLATIDPFRSRKGRETAYGDFVTHGFRSSFKVWATDEAHYDRLTSEYALAHTIGGSEGVYSEDADQFKKRIEMMEEWCEFVGSAKSKVVRMQGKRRAAA